MNQTNEEDEGQEVSLIQAGISFITPHRKVDVEGLHTWIASISDRMPTLTEEHNAVAHMREVIEAFVDRYADNIANSLEAEYILVDSEVLTSLTLGGLRFDKLVEISTAVDFLVTTVGFCPVLRLFNRKDYEQMKETKENNKEKEDSAVFLGRIKIITFEELYYQSPI